MTGLRAEVGSCRLGPRTSTGREVAMIVTREDDGYHKFHNERLRFCFACKGPLTDEFKVMWDGAAAEDGDHLSIGLHAGCAALLALHLAKDGLQADLKNETYSLRTGRKFGG